MSIKLSIPNQNTFNAILMYVTQYIVQICICHVYVHTLRTLSSNVQHF